jgi:tRNA threonylcarbamoyladenosine modification (KEOPS) complex  Pcc1 subunit
MGACLRLSKEACAIFDAVEADALTIDTARSVVSMGRLANGIALGVQTMVVVGAPVLPRVSADQPSR